MANVKLVGGALVGGAVMACAGIGQITGSDLLDSTPRLANHMKGNLHLYCCFVSFVPLCLRTTLVSQRFEIQSSRFLEHAQFKTGSGCQQVVKYLCLDAFVNGPIDGLGKDI